MGWIEKVRDVIRHNLAASPISESAKEAICDDFIVEMETPPAPVDKPKPQPEEEADPLTSRGERLSALRKKAHSDWQPPESL